MNQLYSRNLGLLAMVVFLGLFSSLKAAEPTSVCWTKAVEAADAVHEGDDTKAQEYLTQYAGQPDFGAGVLRIADTYCLKKKFAQAKAYYQNASGALPAEEFAIGEWKYKGLEAVGQGNDVSLKESMDRIMAYTNNPAAACAAQHVAEYCRRSKSPRYAEAETLYQFVIQTYPQHEYALWARRSLIQNYLAQGKLDPAEQHYQTLMVQYASHPALADCVARIANSYGKISELEKARDLFQMILSRWPEGETAPEALGGLIETNIILGDASTDPGQFATFLLNLSKEPQAAKKIYKVANLYQQKLEKEPARQLYQYALEKFPADDFAANCRIALAIQDAGQGNATADETALQTLNTEFTNHPRLVDTVFEIAMGYHDEFNRLRKKHYEDAVVCLQRAQRLYRMIVEQLPPQRLTAESCFCLADSHRILGSVNQAILYYQKVVDTWPDCKYAWNAQYQIGRCYDILKQKGVMSAAEATGKIRSAYQKVVDYYPNCPAARAARAWLESNSQ